MKETLGKIISNNNMVRILKILNKKDSSIRAISKHLRVPENIAKSLIKDLEADGILSINGDNVSITEYGKEISQELTRMGVR
ncbi:hypothetical protein Asulf_01989 [Archaeoglobus sulfaticallidus PM70-1]|uniref:Transcriptional regulator n=1 Tax=Archaeoglobus sulfaticallidus PM70-1 TaxID=387631 RepID=N0BEA6_9EURY|nr:hypothetical protein [Archaeoglobus sulfaticallidus]AGK61954.1 hypothetical protein Asulf_01989 [Archaeoglobus sulfaticallidus PM70-1]